MFNRKIIKYLIKWKNRADRKPLIIRGARQVGKTVSVKMFAEKHFRESILINLDNPEHEMLFRQPVSLDDFEKIVQLKFGKKIVEGETLLFIDEIQNSPGLINLLRFFYEQRPLLHVIAAGSLLEVKMKKEGFNFPVGRVEFAYLYPLDFFEFLEANGQLELLGFLGNCSFKKEIPTAIAAMAKKSFNEYLMVGGMPEAVKVFVTQKDLSALGRVYNSLLTSYSEDIFKYASEAKAKYIRHCLENAPFFVGQAITYAHFAESNFRSHEIAEAFEILEKAMLLYRVMGTSHFNLPLIPKKKKAPKLLFLDVGLVNYKLGLREKMFDFESLNPIFKGQIAEQVVGQHLIQLEETSPPLIYYWYRNSPGSTAEVDFIFYCKDKVVPLEVKFGQSGSLRSSKELVKASKIKSIIRLYNGPMLVEATQIEDTKFNLFSLPFYLLPNLNKIIGENL